MQNIDEKNNATNIVYDLFSCIHIKCVFAIWAKTLTRSFWSLALFGKTEIFRRAH